MCLGIPGKIESIEETESLVKRGCVSFGGLKREVILAYVPEARIGDYVIVHVGFAISIIDEKEAERVFRFLDEMSELEELEAPYP